MTGKTDELLPPAIAAYLSESSASMDDMVDVLDACLAQSFPHDEVAVAAMHHAVGLRDGLLFRSACRQFWNRRAAQPAVKALINQRPNIGASTAEPSLLEILVKYYTPHFSASEAKRLAGRYVSALVSAPADPAPAPADVVSRIARLIATNLSGPTSTDDEIRDAHKADIARTAELIATALSGNPATASANVVEACERLLAALQRYGFPVSDAAVRALVDGGSREAQAVHVAAVQLRAALRTPAPAAPGVMEALRELDDLEAGSRGDGCRAGYWKDKPHRELWRAIEIARTALSAQGWRTDMENAPKDGTRFLVAYHGQVAICRWADGPYDRKTKTYPKAWNVGMDNDARPSLWQTAPPLPAAPTAQGGA